MTDFLIWLALVGCYFCVLVLVFLFVTILRATMRMMDRLEIIEESIETLDNRKVNRPLPPPSTVSLEKM